MKEEVKGKEQLHVSEIQRSCPVVCKEDGWTKEKKHHSTDNVTAL